jgi:hypothetical protein
MTQRDQFNNIQTIVKSMGLNLVLAGGYYRLCNKNFEKLEDFSTLDKVIPYVTMMQKCGLV